MEYNSKPAVFQRFIDRLLEEPFFRGFKYRKNGNKILLKFCGGFYAMEFERSNWYDDVVFTISFVNHYDILYKYLEKYEAECAHCIEFRARMIKYVRERSLIMAGIYEKYKFWYYEKKFTLRTDPDYYDIDYRTVSCVLMDGMYDFLMQFSSLRKVFEARVKPIIYENRMCPDSGGVSWAFDYLVLCRIFDPGKYEILKGKILEDFAIRESRNEPNYMNYRKCLPEMFSEIETTDFCAIMNKKGWTKNDPVPMKQFIENKPDIRRWINFEVH